MASKSEASGTSQASGLVQAINAALVDQGVPLGSSVDVAGGPAAGLGFIVGDDDHDD